ncbi:MAG TPA: choice-of-anchor D domain-containing protein [Chloroflexia bacterium]|nr:choice-of-anchor D domain-containing protein [Chloroflexia bacterium]
MYKTGFYTVKKKWSYLALLGLFLTVLFAPSLAPQATRAASVSSIYFMGNNNYGQFGNGTSTSNAQKTPLAVSIGGLNKIVTVYQASFGIADDGRLLGWGYNADGQLGQGLADQNPHPTPAYVLGPGDNDPYLTNVIDVAGGDQFVVALRSDGTVWTWGNNGYGQLGQGTAGGPNRLRPVQVSGLNNVQVVAIYAGMASVYALTADGSVYGWGDGISGMLGTGDYISHSSPVKLTFPAPPGSTSPVKIRTLAAGYTHALAIDTSNNLWGWGINDSGQLGDGTTTNAPGPKLIQANVQLAAAGYAYSVFSTSDGKVWSSGSNAYGKLGIGDLSISSKLTPQLLPGLTGVSKLAGGYESVLALLADGSVYGWGNSYFGQVGDWPTQYEYRIAQPAKIAGLAGVQSITISRQHSFFTSGPLTRYSAEALDFGSQNLNSVSASQVLTVTNAGSVPLTLSAASLSGANPADFSLTPAASLPLTLNGGEKTTFSLTFKPLATGARSASLDLSDGTGSGPHHVLLTGNGVGRPVLSLSARSLDFGNQIIGSVSPAQTLTLTNSGTADLSINQLQLTGDNAQDFTLSYSANLPLTLAPAASTTLNLGFKPITEGVRNASLVICLTAP